MKTGYKAAIVAIALFTAATAVAQSPLPSAIPSSSPPDVTAIEEAACWLIYFQQGSYGALITVVSGLAAVVGCAMGMYRTALNCLVVALASWLIYPLATVILLMGYPDGTEWILDSATCQNRIGRPLPM